MNYVGIAERLCPVWLYRRAPQPVAVLATPRRAMRLAKRSSLYNAVSGHSTCSAAEGDCGPDITNPKSEDQMQLDSAALHLVASQQ